MEFERASMAQMTEVERLIQAGVSDRKIAKTLQCRRTLIAGIRKKLVSPDLIIQAKKSENRLPPGWALQVDWVVVEKDIREGYQIKRIWEEMAIGLTSHSNFFKYAKIRFANLLDATVTLREFRAGEYCEVDYAGDCWATIKNGCLMDLPTIKNGVSGLS